MISDSTILPIQNKVEAHFLGEDFFAEDGAGEAAAAETFGDSGAAAAASFGEAAKAFFGEDLATGMLNPERAFSPTRPRMVENWKNIKHISVLCLVERDEAPRPPAIKWNSRNLCLVLH